MEAQGLKDRGDKYHIVSIIGGQSSGKSTLLNTMFGTQFDMMDPSKGRRQTTKGIWCSKASGTK
jgi:GTPase Era involved in 16S rRNA processing